MAFEIFAFEVFWSKVFIYGVPEKWECSKPNLLHYLLWQLFIRSFSFIVLPSTRAWTTSCICAKGFCAKVLPVQKKKLQCHPKTTAVELLFPDTHHQLCCGERGVTRPRGMMAAIGRSIEMTSDAHLHVNTARLEMTGPFGELESPTVLVSGPSLRGFNWAKICRTIGLSLGFTVKNRVADEKAIKCLNVQCKMLS